MRSMWPLFFLAVTAGDCTAAIVQLIVGDAFLSEASFAIQGAGAVLAGIAIVMYRKRITSLMRDVH